MSAPADADVRSLISLDGLDKTLFVEAGAGTGKTTELVNRIVHLVLEEGVELDHVAAITFTEAAAAELQARIRIRFEQEAESSNDPERIRRCAAAVEAADVAAISTLHGFASRMLGEFAIAGGLPPRVRVLDEISSQLAHEARWSRFVDALYDDPANEELLTLAALVDIPLEPRYDRHATLKDVAAELNQNWDRIAPLLDEPPPLDQIDFTPFDAAVAAVEALPAQCSDTSDKLYVHLVETVIPTMVAVRDLPDAGQKLRLLNKPDWKKGSGGKKAAWGGADPKELRALIDAVNEAAAEVVGVTADRVLQHLLRFVAREVLDAANARREDGGLEFHDLLVIARDMLRSNQDARDALHRRYTHLLLDEFQDTDPIQIELAVLIASSVSGQVPGSWRDLDVEDGRLFFVGDPKQSIYRFRRADISLFLDARDRFGSDGRWLQLVSNFRTVAPILDSVNALFADAMPEELPGRQPRYQALVPYRAADSGADHRPLLLGGMHPDPKVSAGRLREIEARSVQRVICDIVENPDNWPVQDRRTGQWRPATLADVTVLVPARTSLPYLRAALDAASIPYRLATGTLVYATQEVRDALAVLSAVDDPTDELSLVAALRSPLYACSDVDLFTYHHAGGPWDLRRGSDAAVRPDHPVVAALAHLRSLWERRWWLGPAGLLDALLQERQAHLVAFGDTRPTEVWQRLRFLVDQARSFEESGGSALRSFLAWAELQGADGARVHEPLLPETDLDAVQILTIHGSKGLEFPIAILSGMTTKAGGRRSGVSVLWGETGPPDVSLRRGIATVNHEPRAELESEMDQHEKLRLLYVAATRARDHLVVSCHHKAPSRNGSPQETYAGRVSAFFDDHPELVRRFDENDTDAGSDAGSVLGAAEAGGSGSDGSGSDGSVAPPAVAGAGVADPDRERWIAEREALIGPFRRPRVMSATAIAREALADRFPEDAVDEDEDVDLVGDDGAVVGRRRGRAGTAIGRAVHATLQVLDLAAPAEVEAQVARQCEIESVPEHAETVAALVRSALGSPAIALAARFPHHKELFLSAPFGERVIEGYVDLLIDGPDGMIVVDYKTDSVATPAAIEEKLAVYELQAASYAAVLEQVTGAAVAECRFVFCAASGAIERSVEDLPGAIARVRGVLSR